MANWLLVVACLAFAGLAIWQWIDRAESARLESLVKRGSIATEFQVLEEEVRAGNVVEICETHSGYIGVVTKEGWKMHTQVELGSASLSRAWKEMRAKGADIVFVTE
jgi:hypothetical protein